jgi:pimeloyl-ACP methyl ester carboxylesterase
MTLPEGEERIVRTDDSAELAVTLCGREDGPVVVLAHGWLCARSMWAAVADRLVETGHRVIVYDQRGHGESTPGTVAPTVARLGDDLATLLDELDVRDAVLVGHSMGGFAAMAFACDHLDAFHDRIRSLVLLSTAGYGVGWGRLDPLALWLTRSKAVAWAMTRPRLGLRMVRGAFGRKPRVEDLVATRALIVATDPDIRVACFADFGRMDHREGVVKVDVPTVVMVGKRDTLIPPRLARKTAALIPGARFEVVEWAGHMLPFERPERIAEVVAELSAAG